MTTGHPQLDSSASPTLLYAGGRVVGEIRDGVLVKRVRYQLKNPPAWALEVDHIETLRKLGGDRFRLVDELGRVWAVTLADFDRWGFPVDRGYGHQRGLRLERWTVT